MPRMANGAHAVAHSVVLDECKSRVWVAAREAGAVHEFAFTSSQAGSGVLELKGSVDLAQHGRAWALQVGPYGAVMALTWEEGKVRWWGWVGGCCVVLCRQTAGCMWGFCRRVGAGLSVYAWGVCVLCAMRRGKVLSVM